MHAIGVPTVHSVCMLLVQLTVCILSGDLRARDRSKHDLTKPVNLSIRHRGQRVVCAADQPRLDAVEQTHLRFPCFRSIAARNTAAAATTSRWRAV